MIEDQAEPDCAMPHAAQQSCCRMDLIVFLWLLAQISNCVRAVTAAIESRFAAMDIYTQMFGRDEMLLSNHLFAFILLRAAWWLLDILACHHLDRISFNRRIYFRICGRTAQTVAHLNQIFTSLKRPRNKHNF